MAQSQQTPVLPSQGPVFYPCLSGGHLEQGLAMVIPTSPSGSGIDPCTTLNAPAHIWVPVPQQAFTLNPQADPELLRLLWGPSSI